MRAFIDTNVFAYSYDTSERHKHQSALELLASGLRPVISTQVLAELFVTLTRGPRPMLDSATAQQEVGDLAQLRTVIPTDAELVISAVGTARNHQLSLWDSLILEAAVLGGCDVLYSEDLAHGSTLRGVEVINPFRSGTG